MATDPRESWHRLRRRVRRARRELRLRQDVAPPAFGYAAIGALTLLTVFMAAYALHR